MFQIVKGNVVMKKKVKEQLSASDVLKQLSEMGVSYELTFQDDLTGTHRRVRENEREEFLAFLDSHDKKDTSEEVSPTEGK